jgi:hypothetical protein
VKTISCAEQKSPFNPYVTESHPEIPRGKRWSPYRHFWHVNQGEAEQLSRVLQAKVVTVAEAVLPRAMSWHPKSGEFSAARIRE